MNEHHPLPARQIDPDDIGYNDSASPSFDSILAARLNRRDFLLGSASTGAMAIFGGISLSACNSDASETTPIEKLLGFKAVPKSLADLVLVPEGYSYSVLYALGDPLSASTPAYKNDGSDMDFENRAGDHHDGMEYFGFSAEGLPSSLSNDRALIGMNHEATTNEDTSTPSFFLHTDGGTATLPRPASEVDKETAIHGISVFEIKKTDNKFSYVSSSAYNFRIHCLTPVEIHGTASGSALLKTKYSPDGAMTRGTLNNCGTGRTPWGTLLSGEENWSGYFTRSATDDAARGTDKSVTSLNRYGRKQGAASRHGWETGGSDDKYQRWNISKTGTSTDGSDDYRNELNGMGYIVEVDPYDRTRKARKHTALGRFAHEAAAFSRPVEGKPLAVYQGDDSRNEYIYKWVSSANWSSADANSSDRLATGSKYLDSGKLYVAKFNADGSGQWIELSIANASIAAYAAYTFADQADVCVNSRLAGDAVSATKMDRPEWCNVNPATGEVYFTLTNNSNRRVEPSSSPQLAPDSANPRYYTDMKGSTEQKGNPNGHIIRIAESGGEASATGFTWDVYLFGAESTASTAGVNLSNLTADQDFSSPDGLVFSTSTGICWIQTDDGAYSDVTNCMMLAALPGKVGDGNKLTLSYAKADGSKLNVDTYVGKQPTTDTLKRFLVGPAACEITGACETPDGKALFINIQHPGETTARTNIADPSKYTSHWPGNAGYGSGGSSARPRSATIVITKNDGGRVGS
ncbi:MAG: PhoX family phosphatase [Sulfuricellaceae bacterium]|nr:PhoX family phosphatase [Sulfuricellaceae bacterium]